MPKLVVYSAFIHFKSQLNNNIKKLDELTIEKVSALVNTGNENGVANHSSQRTDKYNGLIEGTYKCEEKTEEEEATTGQTNTGQTGQTNGKTN